MTKLYDTEYELVMLLYNDTFYLLLQVSGRVRFLGSYCAVPGALYRARRSGARRHPVQDAGAPITAATIKYYRGGVYDQRGGVVPGARGLVTESVRTQPAWGVVHGAIFSHADGEHTGSHCVDRVRSAATQCTGWLVGLVRCCARNIASGCEVDKLNEFKETSLFIYGNSIIICFKLYDQSDNQNTIPKFYFLSFLREATESIEGRVRPLASTLHEANIPLPLPLR